MPGRGGHFLPYLLKEFLCPLANLPRASAIAQRDDAAGAWRRRALPWQRDGLPLEHLPRPALAHRLCYCKSDRRYRPKPEVELLANSDVRRLGKECFCTCRSL